MQLGSWLDAILEPGALSVTFQPIVEGGPSVFTTRGVEGFVRDPNGSRLQSASELFGYARLEREEARVDRACIGAVCEAAPGLPASLGVAINIHAATLCADPDVMWFLLATARAKGIAVSRLTVEVVEHVPSWIDGRLAPALARLRRAGIRAALDIDPAWSTERTILACRPDCLKVGAPLVTAVRSDERSRALLQWIAARAAGVGACVVAEGVECPADVAELARLGVGLFQGQVFSPAVAPADVPLHFELPASPPDPVEPVPRAEA
jgi:EAL domain-containing protein (putative c-di-GMP-specific phosphodiesterase class I)